MDGCILWQYGLWSFQTGDKKLERFLPKNQHTRRKLLMSDGTNGTIIAKSQTNDLLKFTILNHKFFILNKDFDILNF